ncbi:MAG: HAD family phosphatase [Eubacterium sp.]|nr:HAD family phosphatase [Eubacterium sp.]
MSIKNIVFDVGGVLVDFCYMEYMRKLGFPEEVCREFESDIVFSGLWNDMDKGDLMLDEAREKFKARLREMYRPCDREVDLFIENIMDIVKEYPYSKGLLKSLKDAGYGVYILSNYPRDLADMHWKEFEFLPVADGHIISAYERVVKPDEKIYRLLTERFGISLEESIFIDDRPVNIDAAVSYGMTGILFKSYDQCVEELRNHGISI